MHAWQVDYAAAVLFLNISMQAPGEAQVPWWQHPEVKMKAGLDPRTQARKSLPVT